MSFLVHILQILMRNKQHQLISDRSLWLQNDCSIGSGVLQPRWLWNLKIDSKRLGKLYLQLRIQIRRKAKKGDAADNNHKFTTVCRAFAVGGKTIKFIHNGQQWVRMALSNKLDISLPTGKQYKELPFMNPILISRLNAAVDYSDCMCIEWYNGTKLTISCDQPPCAKTALLLSSLLISRAIQISSTLHHIKKFEKRHDGECTKIIEGRHEYTSHLCWLGTFAFPILWFLKAYSEESFNSFLVTCIQTWARFSLSIVICYKITSISYEIPL